MTGATLVSRCQERLGDDPNASASNQHYIASEILTAINRCQRIFVLFTLCLETEISFNTTSNTPRYRMLSTIADWLVPLRIRNAAGVKLKPERPSGLAALDHSWSITPTTGLPKRYAHSGFDLLQVYPVATGFLSLPLDITYARGPVNLTLSGSPEIPLRYQPLLIDGAIPILRTKEGAQEWQKVLPLWDRFMDGVSECAGKVRARNRELGYDALPPEIKRYDLSRAKAS